MAKNCVRLEDVIHKEHLLSACVFSFFIAQEELFDHLPFSLSSNKVPIYIGRDINYDSMLEDACKQADISVKDKVPKMQLQSISDALCMLYKAEYGTNYHAFYAWSPGSSHSKILLLVYPDFLRLVITSCNMMNIDTKLGDNHWYIHDLPKLPSRTTPAPSSFEEGLMEHMRALSTPDSFLRSIEVWEPKSWDMSLSHGLSEIILIWILTPGAAHTDSFLTGMYDYSRVKVHLVTSVSGVCSGLKAEKHGLLRLRRVVQSLDLGLPKKESHGMRLEICAASIGNLSAKWLNGFNDCALGRQKIREASESCAVPDLKLFYPSVGDVDKAHASAKKAASNIGCHTRPWNNAPNEIKSIFHHYESKDTGYLFHQKLIMAYNPQDTEATPYYIYVGSANLSASAWGTLEHDKKSNDATCNTKLTKVNNFECGVVIPGHLIEALLETGTESWQSGIVPYVQTAKKYDLTKDRPWNSPDWVAEKNFRQDYRDSLH
ncbi:Tyrosyl-DNA phosphodiesterase [Lachnellula suecica]|uniref:Tyrosyl-DNA phosphodiesterase n=1 Tax=Lachnellula suecica TaxID=602035 RepID=A0A8T9C3T6_9HELO|nr:Tyrosyl-DNA phosphodiesterase [Lachnellula suecica]